MIGQLLQDRSKSCNVPQQCVIYRFAAFHKLPNVEGLKDQGILTLLDHKCHEGNRHEPKLVFIEVELKTPTGVRWYAKR